MTLDRGHTVVCPAYALYQRITMDGDGDGWQFSADALRPRFATPTSANPSPKLLFSSYRRSDKVWGMTPPPDFATVAILVPDSDRNSPRPLPGEFCRILFRWEGRGPDPLVRVRAMRLHATHNSLQAQDSLQPHFPTHHSLYKMRLPSINLCTAVFSE